MADVKIPWRVEIEATLKIRRADGTQEDLGTVGVADLLRTLALQDLLWVESGKPGEFFSAEEIEVWEDERMGWILKLVPKLEMERWQPAREMPHHPARLLLPPGA